MKTRDPGVRRAAFTLLELLVVLATVAILVLLVIPRRGTREPASRMACMSNQRQVALGLLLFATDHDDQFPWRTSITDGSMLETSSEADVVPTYVALTNYRMSPHVFRCRTDPQRTATEAGAALTRTNISYFLGLDATLTNAPSTAFLTGDRHLESNGKPVSPGLFLLSPNASPRWTAELHPGKKQDLGGVISFADGHVEWAPQRRWPDLVVQQTPATYRVAVP